MLPKVLSDKNWEVGHQMIFYLVILLVIATFNGIYTNYINSLPFSWNNYWWIISRTFVLGGIPIAFITVLDYKQKVNFNTNQASNILKKKKKLLEDSEDTTHQISTDLKNETFSFNENDFNYTIAVGNYIDMCSLDENKLKKVTYRITLSSFEMQLAETSNLIRCHRSYLVNLKKVENISGNAQGLKLELKNQSEIVPVSRKYIPIVKQFFIKNP
ncbi:LytR/AlgR family response regulator transcription factor [Winogradskyella forsetii]|uniref:LytR/AlgR family response regulator transcription factor n=1 Tax=Winogradskyella forsetii TaxID=2686077 RepID=UPI0015C0E869|nr:LytTR family transcriptional regulator DNA-binding domain-containing protein [Winogradskyella forsetii]